MNNMKLGVRITLGFAIVIVFTAIMSFVVIISNISSRESMEDIELKSGFQIVLNTFTSAFNTAQMNASIMLYNTDVSAYNNAVAGYNAARVHINNLNQMASGYSALNVNTAAVNRIDSGLDQWRRAVDEVEAANRALAQAQEEFRVLTAAAFESASAIMNNQLNYLREDILDELSSTVMQRRHGRVFLANQIYTSVLRMELEFSQLIDLFDLSVVADAKYNADAILSQSQMYIFGSTDPIDRENGEIVRETVVEYLSGVDAFVAEVEKRDRAARNLRDSAAELLAVIESTQAGIDYTVASKIAETVATGNNTRDMTIILGLSAFIISILIAFITQKSIVPPVKRLVKLVSDVSGGNLNINIDKSLLNKSEIGALTADVYNLIDVIKKVIADLSMISKEVTVNGDIDYRIDANLYQGAYREMVEGIDTLVEGLISDTLMLLNGLKQVSHGNFDYKMNKLPGKKVVMNEEFNLLISNLTNISGEISTLANNAADGRLNITADTSKYSGEWASLLVSLNALVGAVEKPLSEIIGVLGRMESGDFTVAVNGVYKGEFDVVKRAVNTTQQVTLSYIKEISEILGAISQGDLTVRVNRDYIGSYAPIKQALVTILDSLNHSMAEIETTAEQVLTGATQISQSAQQLAEGSQRQAAAIQQLNASIDIINEKTRTSANSAVDANGFSTKAAKDAAGSNDDMKQLVHSMEGIKDSSANISQIIKTIQDISFQTNLLALNASIEAAHAGSHGRGFAVVADQVRSLAGKSQEAAEDTTHLIQDSIDKVNAGVTAATQTAESLEKIVTEVQKTSDLIDQIASMAEEQADSISQVSSGISDIATVIQSNSATSQECAAASQEMNSQAEVLKQLVSFFKIR